MLREQFAEAVEDLAALRSRRPSPTALRVLGRTHGRCSVGRVARLEAADHVADVGRVPALEGPAACRFDPVAADEQAEGRDGGHVGGVGGVRAVGQSGDRRHASGLAEACEQGLDLFKLVGLLVRQGVLEELQGGADQLLLGSRTARW